jgi:hypothetical protein
MKGFSLANNNVHFGNGLTFEAPVVFDFDQDLQFDANVVPGNYRSYFATRSLRANAFATTGVSPWVIFGGGVGRFSPSSQLEFGGKNPNRESTTGVFQMGIGQDVKLWRSLKARGEVRDFWSGTPSLGVDTGKSRQHNFNVGSGVIWQFGKR